jgi:thiaminase/transcriptional activator TenA
MKTADRLRGDAAAIWQKTFEHPFVIELYEGNLPPEKFEFYILQDYYYLVTALQNFSIIASRAEPVETMRELIEILHLEAGGEFEAYGTFLSRLGYTLDDAAGIEPMPVSVSYSSFLLSTSSLRSFAEAITAVLPCFWSYAEIAEQHKDALSRNENDLYRDWGQVYLTASYLDIVERIKKLVNKAGTGFPYDRLRTVFLTASRYEYMFWDAAYTRQQWPV